MSTDFPDRPRDDYETWHGRWLTASRVWVALGVLGALALLWALMGLIGIVFGVPLVSVFIARGLVAGGSSGHAWGRRKIWAEAQGRHHAFDDIWVRIEAEGGGRFRIRADDVWRVLGVSLDDLGRRKLAARLPPAALRQDAQGFWWFAEEALLADLHQRAEGGDQRAWRFCLWLEREVLPPLRRQDGV